MNVVIVESAAKAKTINKYLGSGYTVLASFGHVRDLPSKDGSVEPDKDFEMHWESEGKSLKIMAEITRALKGANKLILATDPDREGEAISWHILQILQDKKVLKGIEVERVTFNAVTKQSILEAMKHPRAIEGPLVSAYLARRALDYLVGFNLSPVLWRKLPGARSAGRVQSVALRLICDREEEIEAFKTEEYWTIEADLKTARNEDVKARLQAIEGKSLKKFDINNATAATAIKHAIEGGRYTVASVEKKAQRRNPWAPFTTSTLQQEASRKLGFSASRTMQVAQKLYEGVDIGGETTGLITYMRTDGVQIIPEAVAEIRHEIGEAYGKRYLPGTPREYKTKAKNAQEAHEAVRPTDVRRRPADVRRTLSDDEAKLYALIWQRAVASQMASAELEQTTADIDTKGRDGKSYNLRATGTVVVFDGFLKLYEEGRDDDEDDDSRRLPALATGDDMKARKIDAKQHFTEPPPRYSEATLVKKMEELGIGRPSTYASTMAVLRERDYVRLDKKRLFPEDKGLLVTAFLKSFFKRYVEYDFTAGLEEKLDLISDDKLDWKQVLRDFWKDFTGQVDDIKDLRVTQVLDALNEVLGPHIFPAKADGGDPRKCPSCAAGKLSLKVGKFGAFVGCSNYPECRFTRQFTNDPDAQAEAAAADGRVLGADPATGLPVTVRKGRFGPYIQLGEPVEKEKPKRSSIPKPFDPATIDLEGALKLLNLPREIGKHPTSGQPITAAIGRYGPFVAHEKTYANLDSIEDVFTVGINRAVDLIQAKIEGKANGGGKGRFGAQKQVLKALGAHPAGGGAIEVLAGKYGAYVKHGATNATVPKDIKPENLTLDQAVALLAEREAKGPSKKPARGKTPAKTATKAGAKPKAPAKKSKKTEPANEEAET